MVLLQWRPQSPGLRETNVSEKDRESGGQRACYIIETWNCYCFLLFAVFIIYYLFFYFFNNIFKLKTNMTLF